MMSDITTITTLCIITFLLSIINMLAYPRKQNWIFDDIGSAWLKAYVLSNLALWGCGAYFGLTLLEIKNKSILMIAFGLSLILAVLATYLIEKIINKIKG